MKDNMGNFWLVQINHQKSSLVRQTLVSLKILNTQYPNFSKWFNTKVKPGLADGNRELWLALTQSGEMAGVLILKNCEEKKICTLYVFEPFRGQGLGALMMQKSIERLKTSSPLATVSSLCLKDYQALLDRFGFKLQKKYANYYKHGLDEFAYNGELQTIEIGEAINA